MKVGNGQDAYIFKNFITIDEWNKAYEKLVELSCTDSGTEYRIPPRSSYFIKNTDYEYCSIRLRDRLHIQPNGVIRICPLHVGTKFRTAINNGGLYSISDAHSEFDILNRCNVCPVQNSNDNKGEPLCVSYKPNEPVLRK